MKPKLYCIGRIGRIRNGKLVVRRRVYDTERQEANRLYNALPKIIALMEATNSKALTRWQMKQWLAPSKLKVKHEHPV